MRLQLRAARRARARARVPVAIAFVAVAIAGGARADSGIGTTTTFFHEAGGPLDMTVLTPSVDARVDFAEEVGVNVGWEADIVSGASVAIVDAPSADVDVVSSATQLDDTRHTFGGGLELRGEFTSMTLGYAYGFESDYRSHGFSVAGRAEMFERNTTFDVSYARGFDEVCDLAQPRAQEAVDRRPLPGSEGCFSAEDRTSHDLSLQTFQASWSQAWTPILTTQVTLTAQLLHGFQGNAYRSVWLGGIYAQENHPRDRARYAGGLSARLWVKPLAGAVQVFGRAYRDTWGIESLTADLGWEQSIAAGLRLRARARYYTQTGAAFYSDDYARDPKGQYFTGDRELSPMSSWTLGARAQWTIPADEDGEVLGFLTSLDLVLKGDWVFYDFPEFHYDQAAVPNDQSIAATVGLDAVF